MAGQGARRRPRGRQARRRACATDAAIDVGRGARVRLARRAQARQRPRRARRRRARAPRPSTSAPPPAASPTACCGAARARVIAVDVGYGQLDWGLRQDERVHVMERTNARYLAARATLPWAPDLVTCDLSFISIGTVWGAVRALPGARLACDGDGQAPVRGGARAGRVGRRRARPGGEGGRGARGGRGHRGGGRRACSARPTPACRAPRATARSSCTPWSGGGAMTPGAPLGSARARSASSRRRRSSACCC